MTERLNFLARVLEWVIKNDNSKATAIVSVTTDAEDWAGSTEGGFYSTFGVEITYLVGDVQRRTSARGYDMESLWHWVVGGAYGE